MSYKLRSADLARMTPEEKSAALTRFMNPTPEEQAQARGELERRVHEFEMRYKMSSEEMLKGFATGTVPDTAEINQWMGLLVALNPNGRYPTSHQARPESVR